MREAKRFAFRPVPEVLLAFPIGLHEVIALLLSVFPLPGLMVEPTHDRTEHEILDESRGLINEMRAIAETILKFGFMTVSDRNTIGDHEHEISSSELELCSNLTRCQATAQSALVASFWRKLRVMRQRE